MTTEGGDQPTPAEWENALRATHTLISQGQFSEALAQTQCLLAQPGANEAVFGSCAGFLIDIGTLESETALIERGVAILETLLKKDLPPKTGRAIRYNLANGLDSVGRLEVSAQGWTYWALQENEKCRRAKHLFAGLLEDKGTDGTPEHWTNYGNRLSLVGRKLEALYAYDQALSLDP